MLSTNIVRQIKIKTKDICHKTKVKHFGFAHKDMFYNTWALVSSEWKLTYNEHLLHKWNKEYIPNTCNC